MPFVKIFFPHWMVLSLLSKIYLITDTLVISGLSILFHWSTSISICKVFPVNTYKIHSWLKLQMQNCGCERSTIKLHMGFWLLRELALSLELLKGQPYVCLSIFVSQYSCLDYSLPCNEHVGSCKFSRSVPFQDCFGTSASPAILYESQNWLVNLYKEATEF